MTATSMHVFVDESGRGSNYYICAAMIAAANVNPCRQRIRSLCLPGQRRWHFTQERDSRRRQIIDVIVSSGYVTALIYAAKGDDVVVRPVALRRLTETLLDRSAARLVIESRQGRDKADRQVLVESLRGVAHPFRYDHLAAHDDPLLWVADALAWCASAGGRWCDRIDGAVEDYIELPVP